MPTNFRKYLMVISIVFSVVALGLGTITFWIKKKSKPIEEIVEALNSSELADADFDSLLRRAHPEFQRMSPEEQEKVLKDPEQLQRFLEETTTQELTKMRDLLFQLPTPVRKRVIEEGALRLKELAESATQEEIEAFVNSAQGKAVLRACREFYISNLNGRQRAEVKPIVDEIFKQVRKVNR